MNQKKLELIARIKNLEVEMTRLKEQIKECKHVKNNREIEDLETKLISIKNQIPDFNEETYLQYKKYFELENELNIKSNLRDKKDNMKVLEEKICYLNEVEQKLCFLYKERATLEKELAKENI